MSYMMFTSATTPNAAQVGQDYLRIGAAVLRPAGASRLAASQTIAAGEGTGALTVTSIWESLDAAMAGTSAFRAHPEVIASINTNHVAQTGRIVAVVDAERGRPEGAFVGSTFGVATAQDPARTAELADIAFGLLGGEGCNGMRFVTAFVAGPQSGMVVGMSYWDSLDGWARGQRALAASADVQRIFRVVGMQIGGRMLSQMIGSA